MHIDPATVLYVYGAFILIGGIIGYVQAKSQISLVMGVVSGIILLGAAYLAGTGNQLGIYIGLAMAAILSVMFILRYVKTKKVMPSLMMAVVSDLALVLLILTKWG
jgi:uncharacterized membrane protein (UPF0136 family)